MGESREAGDTPKLSGHPRTAGGLGRQALSWQTAAQRPARHSFIMDMHVVRGVPRSGAEKRACAARKTGSVGPSQGRKWGRDGWWEGIETGGEALALQQGDADTLNLCTKTACCIMKGGGRVGKRHACRGEMLKGGGRRLGTKGSAVGKKRKVEGQYRSRGRRKRPLELDVLRGLSQERGMCRGCAGRHEWGRRSGAGTAG